MAFENVTYTFYTETLGRSVIPSEIEFNKLTLENILRMKTYLPFLTERAENGIDSATCLACEVCYQDAQAVLFDNLEKKTVSLDGYSETLDVSEKERIQAGNFKTTDEKIRYWIDLFCEFNGGIK